jgi:hypothetical protein
MEATQVEPAELDQQILRVVAEATFVCDLRLRDGQQEMVRVPEAPE